MCVLVIAVIVSVEAEKPLRIPYSQFLDQLEADNIESVTFRETEMDVRLRHPLASGSLAASGQSNTIISRVPDVGDPMLVAELHRQHVVIDVYAPSLWTSLIAHVPWAMMLFFGAMMIVGVVRLLRGGRVSPESTASKMPTFGMMGLIAGWFAKQPHITSSPTDDSDQPKTN